MRSVLVNVGRFSCRLSMLSGWRKSAFSAISSDLLLPRSVRVESGKEVPSGLVQRVKREESASQQPSLSHMQLAAWDLGIGSCIASMHEPEKAKAILGVPQDLHFDVALSFGYPLHSHEQTQAPKPGGRKSFDEVVFWERWANTTHGKACM